MALTEKYVSSSAAGGGTGLTSGSPLTFSEMVTAINAGTEAGSRFNLLIGTYTRPATDTISGSGTATSPVVIRGYALVIGDGYLGRAGSNGALIITNMPVVSYNSSFRLNITGIFVVFETINFIGLIGNYVVVPGADDFLKSCRVLNSSTNAASGGVGLLSPRSSLIDCDILMTGASGGGIAVLASGGNTRVIGNRITNQATGIACASSTVVVSNTIFGGVTGIFMNSAAGAPCIICNTVVGASGDGINIITGATGSQLIASNLITDNGGYGINLVSAGNAAFLSNNRTRDNTSGSINLGTNWVAATNYGSVTAGAGTSDYANAAANDYNLISSSPAVGAGIPQFASIGALQRPQAGAGGISRGRML